MEPKTNKWLLAAIAWEICLLAVVVYLPVLHEPFNTYALDLMDWVIAISSAVTIIVVMEIYKLISRRLAK